MNSAAFRRRWSAETMRLMPALERNAAKVHRLGPRVLLELIVQLGVDHDILPDAAALLAAYAALDPEAVRVAGAGRMPCRRLRLVPAA